MNDVTTREAAATQWAANRTGGGAQQSMTVKVTFFAKITGFVDDVIAKPDLANFAIRNKGNIKSSILTSCNFY